MPCPHGHTAIAAQLQKGWYIGPHQHAAGHRLLAQLRQAHRQEAALVAGRHVLCDGAAEGVFHGGPNLPSAGSVRTRICGADAHALCQAGPKKCCMHQVPVQGRGMYVTWTQWSGLEPCLQEYPHDYGTSPSDKWASIWLRMAARIKWHALSCRCTLATQMSACQPERTSQVSPSSPLHPPAHP